MIDESKCGIPRTTSAGKMNAYGCGQFLYVRYEKESSHICQLLPFIEPLRKPTFFEN